MLIEFLVVFDKGPPSARVRGIDRKGLSKSL